MEPRLKYIGAQAPIHYIGAHQKVFFKNICNFGSSLKTVSEHNLAQIRSIESHWTIWVIGKNRRRRTLRKSSRTQMERKMDLFAAPCDQQKKISRTFNWINNKSFENNTHFLLQVLVGKNRLYCKTPSILVLLSYKASKTWNILLNSGAPDRNTMQCLNIPWDPFGDGDARSQCFPADLRHMCSLWSTWCDAVCRSDSAPSLVLLLLDSLF